MKTSYTGRSKVDLDIAISWYERQRKGLGLDFLDCIEAALVSIAESPHIYRIYHSHFRGCTIKRFPFIIYYTIEGDEIIVHSVFNSRQDPDKRP